MSVRLYLDEDVDPLLARVLRDRGMDCLSTQEAGNRGNLDSEQLSFAMSQGRVFLTFNVKDFEKLAREYAVSNKSHGGIILSQHLPFRELLRRILHILQKHDQDDLNNQVLWLQDFKDSSPP